MYNLHYGEHFGQKSSQQFGKISYYSK